MCEILRRKSTRKKVRTTIVEKMKIIIDRENVSSFQFRDSRVVSLDTEDKTEIRPPSIVHAKSNVYLILYL